MKALDQNILTKDEMKKVCGGYWVDVPNPDGTITRVWV